MSSEEQNLQQHAQWLASLASGHFVQPTPDSGSQSDNAPSADEHGDMAVQPIVKLDHETGSPVFDGQPTTPTTPFNLRKKRKVSNGFVLWLASPAFSLFKMHKSSSLLQTVYLIVQHI
jgi:hypothetical protein